MRQERRRFPRVPESFSVQYRAAGELGATWCTVTTQNLSAGGIRFRSAEPLEVGALLLLKFTLPGAAQMLDFRAHVIWSHMQASGVTEVGVELLDVTLQQRALIDRLVAFLRNRV